VRSLDRLNVWVERARDTGLVAHARVIGEHRSDAGRARAAFRSRCRANEACYVPLAIARAARRAAVYSAAMIAPDQIPEARRLSVLKPLLEDPGVLKIGHDLKFTWQVFAQRGIEMASYRRHHADVVCRSMPAAPVTRWNRWPSAPSITPPSTSTN
jgi:DNA polymerase-1